MYREHRNKFTIQIIFFILFSVVVHSAIASAIEDFKRGKAAFNQKMFSDAVVAFDSAKAKGMHHPALYHNLGSAYYFLQAYEKAKKNFSTAYQFPQMRPLAAYNLGKVMLKQEKFPQAYAWFEHAMHLSEDDELRQLAEQRVEELSKYSPKPAKNWRYSFDLAVGRDDNVYFSPTEVSTGVDDAYISLVIGARGYLLGNRNHGWSLAPYLYSIKYDTENQHDYTLARITSLYHVELAGLYHAVGGVIEHSLFNNEDYQNSFGFEYALGYHPTDQSYIELEYQYSDIDTLNSRYDYLEGHRQQARLSYQFWRTQYRVRSYLAWEENGRKDYISSAGPISYSPRRLTGAVDYEWDFHNDWRLSSSLMYRDSAYPSARVDHTTETRIRSDRQIQAFLGLSYKFYKNYRLTTRWRYIDNDSNVAVRRYDRNLVEISLNRDF